MAFSPDPALLTQVVNMLVAAQVPGADQAAVQKVRSPPRMP